MSQATLLPPECNPINSPLASKIHDAVTLAMQECIRKWADHTDTVLSNSYKIVDLNSPLKKTAAAVNAIYGKVNTVSKLAPKLKIGGGTIGIGLKALDLLAAAEEKEYNKIKMVVTGNLQEAIRNISTIIHRLPEYYFIKNPRAELERFFLVDMYKDIYANSFSQFSIHSIKDEIIRNLQESNTFLTDKNEIYKSIYGNLKTIGDKINKFMSGFRSLADATLDEFPPLNFIAGNPFDSISVDNTLDGINNPVSIQTMGITDPTKAAEVLANIWNYDIVDTGFLSETIIATKKSSDTFINNIPKASNTAYTFLKWLSDKGSLRHGELANKSRYYQSLETKQGEILSNRKLVCRLQAQPDTIRILKSKKP